MHIKGYLALAQKVSSWTKLPVSPIHTGKTTTQYEAYKVGARVKVFSLMQSVT